ncbi:hypothetical protein ACQPZJ_25205 [Actinoplanes sp. CA-054009]
MTEDLRALLRDDLSAERPPPLGDVVGAALRDGQRIRRQRRWLSAGGGAVAVAGVIAVAVVGGSVLRGSGAVSGDPGTVVAAPGEPQVSASGRAVAPRVTAPEQGGATVPTLPPQSVPVSPAAPGSGGYTRILAIPSGTQRPAEKQTKATPSAMVFLLTQLLPPEVARSYTVSPGAELRVQAYLNDGFGPGRVQVAVGRTGRTTPGAGRGDVAKVKIVAFPGDCRRDTSVTAGWDDGTVVRMDIGCPDGAAARGRAVPPVPPVLDPDVAAKIAADPRWGMTMDASLVTVGEKMYPDLPVMPG